MIPDVSVVASLLFLAAISAPGIALLRRAGPFLTPLELVGYGAPLGMVLGSLALLGVSAVLGFAPGPIGLVGLGALAAAWWLAGGRSLLPAVLGERARVALDGRKPGAVLRTRLAGARRTIGLGGLVLLAFLAVRWAQFWIAAVPTVDGDLWAGHVNLWGDWPVHFGIVSAFTDGGMIPPEHPRFSGHPLSYHFLADLTAAAMSRLGMGPAAALSLHSYVGCLLVAVAIFAFARRLTRRTDAAALALLLFVYGGGLGFLAAANRMAASGDVLGTLAAGPWDYHWKTDLNYQWVNMFFGFLASQRAFLYGLPLACAIFALLLDAIRRGSTRRFLAAGLVAGLLPLAHLPTMLALAIVTPVLVVAFPRRGWLVFLVAWGALAAPQVLLQQGGSPGVLAAFRVLLGWVAGPDPWPWFWLKNMGWFAPLVLVALIARRVVPERSRRLLAAFMAIFVVANLVVFQPWDWDNHKILVYWFLAVVILVAALLARAWRRHPSAAVRTLIVGIIVTMVLSGALEDLTALEGKSRYLMLTADQIALAAEVRARTPADAIFVTGMENNDPIAMLTGRRLYVGYPNWLWTEGIPYEARREEALAILRFDAGAPSLIARDGIDFVVIGPYERNTLKADEAAFRARYTALVTVGAYTVYDVRTPRS